MDTRGAESTCLKFFACGPYDGGIKNDRYHGFGHVTLTGTNEYAGMFEDGRMHGLGTMSWNDGLKYVGPWIRNSATGTGSLSWPNGTDYYGDVVKGRRHGFGVMFHEDNVYCGQWSEGKRHGFGIQVSPSVTYHGEWKDGTRCGWGIATFSSGNTYCGHWKNDVMEGFGVFTWLSDNTLKTSSAVTPYRPGSEGPREYVKQLRQVLGNVGCTSPGPLGPFTPSCVERSDIFERYTGEFRNNVPHGQGQYEVYFFHGDTREIPFDTSNQYNGSFVDGLRHGFGVQKYADGTLFQGTWSANMKHGKGFILHPDGTRDEVEMAHDAPVRTRPTTARNNSSEATLSVEDTLELDDLFLSPSDRDALREHLTRFKGSLKHLFICYCKLWQPQDYGAVAQRVLHRESTVEDILFVDKVDDEVIKAIPEGVPLKDRNNRLITEMTRRADAVAKQAAEKGMQAVVAAGEDYALNAKQYHADADANKDSDNDNDDIVSTMQQSTNDSRTKAASALRKRPATPLLEGNSIRSQFGPPTAVPLKVTRTERLLHISVDQFHALLRDALVLDGELTLAVVNDIIQVCIDRSRQQERGCGLDANDHQEACITRPSDATQQAMSFRHFVECIVRVADAKFTVTSVFAVAAAQHRWTLADRVEFLLDHFLEPLRITLTEIEMSGELAPFDFPQYEADDTGDHTLEDLRRLAQRTIQREQAKAAAAAQQKLSLTTSALPSKNAGRQQSDAECGDGTTSDEGITVVAQPLSTEEFEATVSDRSVFPLSQTSEVKIVTVDVMSTKGTRRSHQLYLVQQDGASFFAGVVPSYHPSVSSVDVYDVLAALPTRLLHAGNCVKPHIEKHIQLIVKLFNECGEDGRASLGTLIKKLHRVGVLCDEVHRNAEDESAHLAHEGDGRHTPPPTIHVHSDKPPSVTTASFVHVVLEMEFSCLLPSRPEYCCPSIYLERRSLVTREIYDDSSVKAQIRTSPDFAEAVAIAVRHTELWDAKRRVFHVPNFSSSGESWWLLAFGQHMVFEQFVDVLVRLAMQLYGTDNIADAMNKTFQRLQSQELEPNDVERAMIAIPPPTVMDKPLPVRRKNAPTTIVDDKNKSKKAPKK